MNKVLQNTTQSINQIVKCQGWSQNSHYFPPAATTRKNLNNPQRSCSSFNSRRTLAPLPVFLHLFCGLYSTLLSRLPTGEGLHSDSLSTTSIYSSVLEWHVCSVVSQLAFAAPGASQQIKPMHKMNSVEFVHFFVSVTFGFSSAAMAQVIECVKNLWYAARFSAMITSRNPKILMYFKALCFFVTSAKRACETFFWRS